MEPQQPDPVDAWAKQYGLQPTSPAALPPNTPAAIPSVPWGDVPRHLSVGVGKGAATTAVGMGDLALSIGMPVYQRGEGIKWVDLADSIDEIAKAAGVTLDSRAKLSELRKSPLLAAANTPQEAGKLTEQIAEFFLLPTGKAKAAKTSIGLIPKVVAAVRSYLPEAIVQGAGAAALTKAQTGSIEDAKASGVLGAVAPAAGRVAAALPTAIKNAAERNIYRFLAPTKEVTKTEAGRIIPQFLERGTMGTRLAVKEAATRGEQVAGAAVGAAERAATAVKPGDVVATQGLRDAMGFMERKALTRDAKGQMVPVVGREQYYAIAKGFREFAESLPDKIPIEQAADLKRQWQSVVTAGKAWDSQLPEKIMGNVAKRAQAKIRAELLSEAPDLRTVYDEYAYQRGLRDVLAQTVKRTSAHEPGWMKRSWLPATLSGGYSYKETNDPLKAAAGFAAGSVLGRMMASPLWQTVSGQLKSRLADAIVAGKADDAVRAIVKAAPRILDGSGGADPTAASGWAANEIKSQIGRDPTEAEITRFLAKYPYPGQ